VERKARLAFGRELYPAEVYQCLQGMPQVLFVQSAEIYDAPPGGRARARRRPSIEVLLHGVIVSGIHEMTFV